MIDMNLKLLKNDLLLVLTAAIWGLAFVAQRVGMRYIGPFTFNSIRFALGSLSLLPFLYFQNRTGRNRERNPQVGKGRILLYGLLAGSALFLGASFQQVGIVYTTAGKSGFITGLYVVMVPLSGLLWGQKAGLGRWLGAFLALTGLYFLSVTEHFSMSKGDFLVLLSAFFWTAHLQIIGWLSPKTDPIRLSCLQFAFCSLFSLPAAFLFETIRPPAILEAAVPILYGGLGSVGIAYTLQVVAQRKAHPAHAAIILSMEGVFAVLGGWLIIDEALSPRGLLGCALMLAGMISAQSSLLKRPTYKK